MDIYYKCFSYTSDLVMGNASLQEANASLIATRNTGPFLSALYTEGRDVDQ